MRVLNVDSVIASAASDLLAKYSHRSLGTNDALIATTAQVKRLPLLTRNRKHFEFIEEIALADIPPAQLRITDASAPHGRTCPSPNATHLYVVSSSSPIGPRTWSFCVLTATSAPKPNCPPSLKRVLALTNTADELISSTKRVALAQSFVRMLSECSVLCYLDVGDGLFDAVHDLDTEDQPQPFGVEVVGAGREHHRVPSTIFQDRKRLRRGAQFDIALRQAGGHHRQEAFCHRSMHQDGVEGVADAGALHLGILHDRHRLVEIRRFRPRRCGRCPCPR